MKRNAFTLIEMLLATVLSAVLMAAVLGILGGVARDRNRLAAAEAAPRYGPLVDRIAWDLANARTMNQSLDGLSLVLTGHGGIDPATLEPNGRLARVAYRIYPDGSGGCLVREQQYLDEPAAPAPWREWAGQGVTAIRVDGASTPEPQDGAAPAIGPAPVVAPLQRGPASRLGARVRLHLEINGAAIDRDLQVR